NWKSDQFFRRILLMFIVPNILFYSMLQHKEVRFLFQLQPFLLLFAAKTIYHTTWKRNFLIGYLALNIPLTIHFSLIHEVKPLKMLEHVKKIIEKQENPFVFFLASYHVS